MKEEKGITLIALITYVIIMTFVVAGVAAVTNSLYSNVKDLDIDTKGAVDFAKFNMYLLNDIKNKDTEIVSSSDNQLLLSVTDDSERTENISYSVQGGSLYRNSVRICNDVEEARIVVDSNNNEFTIYLKIKDYQKTMSYVLENRITENQDVII